MRTDWMSRVAGAVAMVVVASMVPPRVGAQTLARRVASVSDGRVRLSFAAKPDVCGSGNSISRGGDMRMNWTPDHNDDIEFDPGCVHSPVRVVVEVARGQITKVRTYVGGRWRPATAGVTDLGTVSDRDAAEFLLGVAATTTPSAAGDAILPAMLADSVTVWPRLVELARDESRPRETRRQAMFWLSQAAGDRITPRNISLANSESVTEVKKSAVFALSQRRNGEAIPALIEIARNNRDPEVQKSALFWLGQTFDSRAVALFAEILARR